MAQRDIPLQPGETAATANLRRLAAAAGWCVTHTTDGKHSDGSLHYARNGARAVDLADRRGTVDQLGPVYGPLAMLALNRAIRLLVPLPLISELICGHPQAVCVKNGVVLDGEQGRPTADAVYTQEVLDEHNDHNHLAVVAGFTFTTSEVTMPTTLAAAVTVVAGFPYEDGYVLVLNTGRVYAFNCVWQGGLTIDGQTVTADLPKP